MKEKKTWYIRFVFYLFAKRDHKYTKQEKTRYFLTILLILVLVGGIGYGFSYMHNSKPYEEVHDAEYCEYVNEKLEDVANVVIDKEIGINLKQVPDIISKYEIKYTGKRIDFTFWLDKKQVVSQYCIEIGKNPKQSDAKKYIAMTVQISTDFQEISMSPFGDTVPTRENYESSLPVVIIMEGIYCGLVIFMALGLVIMIIFVGAYIEEEIEYEEGNQLS